MSCTDVQTIQAGNGTKTQFSFDFPYIFKSEIHVYFWNATTKEWDEKLTTDATYPWQVTDANPTIVEFTSTAPPAPATPVDPNESTIDNVKIRRITNLDDIRALFNPGSAIRSDDLNNNFEQLRYAIQESNCPGVTDEVYEYLLENYWDRFDNTLYSADAWRSDDATIATTAALDQRFQDEVNDTLTKAELAAASDVMPDNDDAVPTTGATKDYIDHVIETDILVDATGLNKTGSGGQVTIGISAGSVDLDRIKASDIDTSADSWSNNDNTIATTAKIDDMIDAAITGDIAVDSTGLSVTDDGDGTITLGIAAGSVDFDRIKASDIITQSEQDAGVAETDNNIFTALAAARRFDTFVQTGTPAGSDWEVGKTWLQNDSDLTLSVWNGSAWTAITSGGTFTNQPNVVYVDASSGDDNNDGHRISRPKLSITSAIDQINSEIEIDVTADGFNGGSSYVDGTYTGVSLTHSSGTGIGTGLTATVGVSGGAVTSVTLSAAQQTVLEEYSIGDVLTASNTELGNSGSGLLIPITGTGDGQIVVVAAGVYREAAPIQIKRRNVSIIGQALRSCIVHPTVATENNNLFELNSGSYISSLTLTGVQAGTGTGNTLDAELPVTQGWNFAFYDGAYIVKSPYIQNCTNFSDSEIDNNDLLAHRPRGGAAGDTDSAPTGGGMLINGATPADDSPLRSMVADSYTHVGLNGPGVLVTNNGYAQITSSYAFFNKYHIKCLNGGQANLAASTTDFGDQALVADGRSTSAIFTADLSTAAGDGDITFTIGEPTAAASWHGTATRPQGNMLVELNSITYPILSATANGSGWDVTISRPNPNNRSENLGLNGAVATPATASFFLRSMVASSGHTMEYVGSGTNYSALPENGGVPDETQQIVESNNGKVWTAITDHNGKFKIGGNQTDDPIFEVDQQLGFVTIPEGSIAFNLLSDLTPQLGGDLDVNGQTITSASDGNIVIDPDGTGVIELGSNVGVGTASPQTELHLKTSGATGPTIRLEGTAPLAADSLLGGIDFFNIDGSGFGPQVGAFVRANADGAGGDGGYLAFGTNDAATGSEGADATEKARIDSSGRLLVGTPSSSFNTRFIVKNNATSSGPGSVCIGTTTESPTNGATIGANIYLSSADDNIGEIRVRRDGGTWTNGTSHPSRLEFSTTEDGLSSPTIRMTIGSTGNIGIGTTVTTASRLHVRDDLTTAYTPGSQVISTLQNLDTTTAYTPALIQWQARGSTTTTSSWYAGNAGLDTTYSQSAFVIGNRTGASSYSERLRIDGSGNVGIGQTGPAARLDVASPRAATVDTAIFGTTGTGSAGDVARILIKNVNSLGGQNQGVGIGGVYATDGTNDAHLAFYSNSGGLQERVRIDSSGNVGIGTTTPEELLHLRDASGPVIRLENTDTTIVAGNSFGSLEFECNDTSNAAGIVGKIECFAHTTMDGSAANGGALRFFTSDAGPSRALTEHMRINSLGNVGIGSLNPSYRLSVVSSEGVASAQFTDATNSTLRMMHPSAGVGLISVGSSQHLALGTAFAEAARIDSSGRLLVGKSSSGNSIAGAEFSSTGLSQFTVDNNYVSIFNRKTSDGVLIYLQQDEANEGSISVSGTTVSYNGAHLARWSQLPGGVERTEILRGSVLSNIDEMCEWGEEENEQLNRMKVSDVEGDKNVSGVFQAWDDDDDTYINDFYCAMTGDFVIRIAQGVTVERGDLLMSAGDGTAKPQDDDIIRSKTIAKVTSTNVSCTYDDGSYCVPCVLMAC